MIQNNKIKIKPVKRKKIKVIEKAIKILENKKTEESELEEETEEIEESKFLRFEHGVFTGKINPVLDKLAQAPIERNLEDELARLNTSENKDDVRGGDYFEQTSGKTDYLRNTAETNIQRQQREANESEGRKQLHVEPNILGLDSSRNRFTPVRDARWESPQENQTDKGEYIVQLESFDAERASEGEINLQRKYKRRF